MRIVLRLLIALNWTVAGLSSVQVVSHPRLWHSVCLEVTYREMVAEGVDSPSDNDHYPEWYRRGDVERGRLSRLEQVGYYGWLAAMCVGAISAVGLMAVFPKKVKSPTK